MKVVPVLAPLPVDRADPARRLRQDRLGGKTHAADDLAAPIAYEPDFSAAASTPSTTDELVETLEKEGLERLAADDDDKPIEQSDNSLVRLLNNMIVEAHKEGVSDIHIESYPGKEKIRVRFRKDGVLRTYLELPANYRNALIARVKIMCDLDISERRQPAGRQDQLRQVRRRSTGSSCASRRSRPTTASRTSSCACSPRRGRSRSTCSACPSRTA